jgi:hypothetical protein
MSRWNFRVEHFCFNVLFNTIYNCYYCYYGEGNDAKSISRQYSLKVTKLEHEAEQAKVELTETEKQLQELENKDLSDVALKVKLQKEFRKKMDAAKLRIQVT